MKVCRVREPWVSERWWRRHCHISSVAYHHTNCISICYGFSVKGCGHKSEVDKKRITATSLIKESKGCFCVGDSSGVGPVSCCSWTATVGPSWGSRRTHPLPGQVGSCWEGNKAECNMAWRALFLVGFQPGAYHLQWKALVYLPDWRMLLEIQSEPAFQWRWSWTWGYQENHCECVGPLLSGSGRSTSAMGREMIHVFSPGHAWAWVLCCYGDQRLLSILLEQCLGLNPIRGMCLDETEMKWAVVQRGWPEWAEQKRKAKYNLFYLLFNWKVFWACDYSKPHFFGARRLSWAGRSSTLLQISLPSQQHRLAAPLSVQEGWASTSEVSALSW